MIGMTTILKRIKKEILSWPNVNAKPHRFGGIEFRIDKREMGHVHDERLADLPFPMKIRNELVNSGRVSPYHVLPQSGWISYWINRGEDDVPSAIELFRMRYEQLIPRSQAKQEESSEVHAQPTTSKGQVLLERYDKGN
jgi:Luciferase